MRAVASPVLNLADHAALVAALRDPRVWPDAPAQVELIETHISSVLLAGAHACKIKKPVRFSFLDFSALERRRHFCEEELRINRRTAPQLYLGVRPIVGSIGSPRLGGAGGDGDGDGDAIEYCVWMRRFDSAHTLDRLAAAGALTEAHIDALAQAIAALHAAAAPAPPDSDNGSAATARRWALRNLHDLRAGAQAATDRDRLDALLAWTEREAARLAPVIEARRAAGHVRECHGDLHLGNAVLIDGVPLLFDALEFDPELRFIDVASDLAFMFMDLLDHGLAALGWRLLDGWLQASGDWEAAPLLRFYAVYRALVRARVAQLRAQQGGSSTRLSRLRQQVSYTHYLALAERLAQPPAPVLVVMSGLSGSGKSTAAAAIAQALGALRIRSDVERKRLAGIDPQARGDAALYAPAMTARTYAHMQALAASLLDAGLSVVVDSAALQAAERSALAAVARRRGLRVAIVACEAPVEVLAARIDARGRTGADPSDATRDVLQRQLGWRQARAADEPEHWPLDTAVDRAQLQHACAALAQRLAARG